MRVIFESLDFDRKSAMKKYTAAISKIYDKLDLYRKHNPDQLIPRHITIRGVPHIFTQLGDKLIKDFHHTVPEIDIQLTEHYVNILIEPVPINKPNMQTAHILFKDAHFNQMPVSDLNDLFPCIINDCKVTVVRNMGNGFMVDYTGDKPITVDTFFHHLAYARMLLEVSNQPRIDLE